MAGVGHPGRPVHRQPETRSGRERRMHALRCMRTARYHPEPCGTPAVGQTRRDRPIRLYDLPGRPNRSRVEKKVLPQEPRHNTSAYSYPGRRTRQHRTARLNGGRGRNCWTRTRVVRIL